MRCDKSVMMIDGQVIKNLYKSFIDNIYVICSTPPQYP